jgi:GntR family transcriptional regulator/MocR family aminotransferase
VWAGIEPSHAFERPAAFDFRAGVPDARLFPFDTWRRLLGREWRAESVGSGGYGDPAGDPDLREAIARHLAVSRGVHASAADVIVTNGTQQAADCVARALLAPGDLVAVEDPGYPPPRRLFASMGARSRASGSTTRASWPTRSRPPPASCSSAVPPVPPGDRDVAPPALALLRWAADHDAAILEDDYDSEFRLTGRPIEPLQALDPSGRVIYVGTFSKTMLATLRLGFVIVPASLRHAVATAKYVTDWHTSLPTQRALAAFIAGGALARHVRRMRTVYRRRHERIVAVLRRDFAEHLTVLPAAAGVHVAALARRHSSAEVDAIVARAADLGVAVHALSGSRSAGRRGRASCSATGRSRRRTSSPAWRGSGRRSTAADGRVAGGRGGSRSAGQDRRPRIDCSARPGLALGAVRGST